MVSRPSSTDRIVVIDDTVRKVFEFYVSLFPNYREAGKAVGVGKDTIAKYATESTHLSYPVYLAMCRQIESRCTPKAIAVEFGSAGLDRLAVDVRDKNGGQIDHVMYEITPQLNKLIEHFCKFFPNRSRAARALDLNPRTLKAYTNGQIQSFPRNRFDRLIELLRDKGQDDSSLLEAIDARGWDEVLRERSRSETLHVENGDLLDRVVEVLVQGDVDLKKTDRPIYNACRRTFGSLGSAYDAAMDHLASETERQAKVLMQEGRVTEAHELIVRFEQAIRSYTAKVRARARAARRHSRTSWKPKVLELVQQKEQVKSWIFKESQLHPTINTQSEDDKLRLAHPYLREFRTYRRDGCFEQGELIFHAVFGMGRVTSIPDRGRMRVRFAPKIGSKILAFQPKPYI